MSLSFLGLAACGYLAGMVGSIIGMYCNANQVSERNGRLFLLVVFWMVTINPIVQVVKVVVALTAACLLTGSGYALCSTATICAVISFLFMLLLPLITRLGR